MLEHIFLEASSPLSLLLFKFTVISMGVSCAGFGLLFFFLAEALVADVTGDAGGDTDGLGTEIPSSVCGISGTGSGTGVAGASSDAGSEAGSGSRIVSFVGEAVAELVSPAFEGFLFFTGHFGPAFISFGMIVGFRLDWTRIYPFSLLGWLPTDSSSCSSCGGCGVPLVFFRAEFGNVTKLLAAPAAQSSAFYHHHHLPLSANNCFRDGLETLPS